MSHAACRRRAIAGAIGLFVLLACEPRPGPFDARLYRASSPATPLDQGASLAAGDELFMELASSSDLHVYVVNEDAAGATNLLFPCRGLDTGSRLEAAVHRLPRNLAAAQTYWPVEVLTAREQIWVVASEQPVAELEAVLASAPWAVPCAARFEGAAEGLLEALTEAAPRLQSRSTQHRAARQARRVELPAGGRFVWAMLFDLNGTGGRPP